MIGLVMLAQAARDRERARSLVVALAAGAVPIALLLIANWRTTATHYASIEVCGTNHSLGLHDDPAGNPHTPWRAFLLAIKYAAQLNWIGTAWPIPLLLIVVIGLLLVRRAQRWDALLLSYFGAQLVVYAFYWHDGQFVGPRFLFTALPAMLILAARAPFIVSERARGVWWRVAVATIPCASRRMVEVDAAVRRSGVRHEFRGARSLNVTPRSISIACHRRRVGLVQKARARVCTTVGDSGLPSRSCAAVGYAAACRCWKPFVPRTLAPSAPGAGSPTSSHPAVRASDASPQRRLRFRMTIRPDQRHRARTNPREFGHTPRYFGCCPHRFGPRTTVYGRVRHGPGERTIAARAVR